MSSRSGSLYLFILVGVYVGGCLSLLCSPNEPYHEVIQMNFCPPEDINEMQSGEDERLFGDEVCKNWCEQLSTQVALEVIDSGSGRVQFTVPTWPHRCDHTCYEFNLRRAERPTLLSQQECQLLGVGGSGDNFQQKHSIREYAVGTEDYGQPVAHNITCDESVQVVFNYVYSGCYMLEVQPHVAESTRRSCDFQPIAIVTNYTMARPFDVPPIITVQQYPQSHQSRLTIREALLQERSPVRLSVSITDRLVEGDRSYCTGGSDIYWLITVQGESECRCNPIMLLHNTSKDDHCEHYGDTISCTMHGVAAGNHCAVVQFIDDRCAANTVWTQAGQHCRFYAPFTMEADARDSRLVVVPQQSVTERSHIGGNYIIMGIVLLALLVAVLAAIAYSQVSSHLRLKQQPYKNHEVQNQLIELKESPRVLLLYPRDCPLFMNAMAEFRAILQDLFKCKVSDYWDPELWDQVAISPGDWLRCLATDPTARVIVMATECAHLLDMGSLTYRNPQCYDGLYRLGLRLLHNYHLHDSYTRIFVARFESPMDENKPLTFLNPHNVFVLPLHFDKLFLSIHNLESVGNSNVGLERHLAVMQFAVAVQVYNEYRVKNPNYLLDTIFRPSKR